MKLRKSILCLAIAVGTGCSGNNPASLVQSAKDHMAKAEYSAAMIQLKNALQKEPGHTEARYLLGVSLLENGDVAAAEIEFSKARQSGYNGEELDVALARALLARGEYNRVITDFHGKKLAAPKLQAELRAIIGAAQLGQNRRDEARAMFDEALALDASSPTANVGLARLAAMDRDLAGALSRVDVALKARPNNGEALLLKADLLAAQKQNEAAETAYREAAAAPAYKVVARTALIAHLLRNRSLDKADREVAELEKIAPKDPRTAYAKASVRSEQGDAAGAREAVQQVLKAAPNHVPSLMLAGKAALELGDYAEAESHFRKVLQANRDFVLAKRFLALTHLRMGQTDVALDEVQELLQARPEDPNIAALAGEVYLASGDVAAAARHYEKANSLVPDSATVQTRLALVRLASGDVDRGIKELEASSASHPTDYQADLALIATYLQKRQPDKALQAIDSLEKKQPQNPRTHSLRGTALLQKKDIAGARASFEQALKLNPTYMPAVSNLAQLDVAEKNPSAAKARYQAVLKKEPNNEQALSQLAVLLRITGAPKDEIENLLRQAVAGNPNSANARAALVNFYMRNADITKAVTAAQEAQVALPNNGLVLDVLGRTQLAAGQARQAVGTYQKLVELAPKLPGPLIQLARAQLGVKNHDEAIKSLRAALALRPDLAAVEGDITGIYVATGRYSQALAEARTVQKERPDQPLGYVLEGEIYLAQKNFGAAENTYRAALKKFDAPVIAIRTHTVMSAGGKGSEADAIAEKWISAHPKDISVVAYLAQRDLSDKRYAEAEARYALALQRDPNNALVLNNLAWLNHELKQPKAREYAERANDIAPNTPQIMDTLGWILSESGERERGLQLLGRAAEMAPQAYAIRLNFAKALVKAGRKDAARKELEALAKLDSKHPVQREASALLANL